MADAPHDHTHQYLAHFGLSGQTHAPAHRVFRFEDGRRHHAAASGLQPIQTFLTGSLLSIVMAAVSLVIYSVVMAGYDLGILGVFLLGSAFYIGWILIFLKRRRKLDYMRFQESANNQSNIVQLINGMQDIKLNNCEKQKRWEWERIQAKLFKVSIKSLTLGQTQEVGGTFIDQTKNVIISFLAASAVADGK